MPKSPNQKLKILYLMRILLTETDETHMLTMGELISKLADLGVSAERKTVYDDIEALRLYGLDIVMEKTRSYGYYVAARDFELPELKLLADAVQSSKFITEKKSLELIKKLESLASVYDAGKLRRQVFIHSRVKSMNESIYYSVDALHEAVARRKKISFKYFDYNIHKKRVFRKSGASYIVSPVALTWNEENYYLIAHSEDREGLSHFRVDRMSGVTITGIDCGKDRPEFNLAEYSKRVFGMFGGEVAEVRLRVSNQLTGAIIDRFGKDIIIIADDEQHFTVTVSVALSPIFYGWLFQFGELCEVLSPQRLRDDLKRRAEEFAKRLE